MSGLRVAVALLSMLAMAPAAAQGIGTPLGTLDATLDADEEALGVAYDAGKDPLPHDDVLIVRETVREAQVAWYGSAASMPLAAEAGLRGLVVEHAAFPTAAEALAGLQHARPAGAPWPYVGPDGLDVDFEVDAFYRHPGVPGWPVLLYPDQQYGIGWGLGYDRVTVPNAIAGSSDRAADDLGGDLAFACRAFTAQAGAELDACQNQAATLAALGPDVRLHTELQRVTLLVDPAAERAQGLGADGAAVAARAVEAGVRGAPGVPGLPAAPSGASLDPLASPAAADDSAQPGFTAQGALGGGLAWAGLDTALPVALVALALLAPIAALYRRLLSHETLRHPIRDDMLQRIRAHPGIHESQLAREMGLRHTHVQYHLRILQQARIVEQRRFGGLKCLFEVGRLSEAEKGAAMAERGRGMAVLAAVQAEPGIPQRILARRLAMAESSVKWHLDRLLASGMVRIERMQGAKLVWPAPAEPEPLPTAPAPPVASAPITNVLHPAPRPQS